MVVHRPETVRQRRAALTWMAGQDGRFTIDEVWRGCGEGVTYSVVHLLTVELRREGLLVVDHRPGERRRPLLFRWAPGVEG